MGSFEASDSSKPSYFRDPNFWTLAATRMTWHDSLLQAALGLVIGSKGRSIKQMRATPGITCVDLDPQGGCLAHWIRHNNWIQSWRYMSWPCHCGRLADSVPCKHCLGVSVLSRSSMLFINFWDVQETLLLFRPDTQYLNNKLQASTLVWNGLNLIYCWE